MPKFTFICEHRDFNTYDLDSKNILETNKESLYDVIEEFERFLKGAGFVFDGQLDIVSEEAETIKQQANDYQHDLFVSNYDMSWTNSYSAYDVDPSVTFGDIDFTIDPVISFGNDDIQISLDDYQSTQWPFPANERPQ